jgi:feruloyl esterase
MDADSADLSGLAARKAKLIHYTGWGDGNVSPSSSINYHGRVQAFFRGKGQKADDSYRLFMVPGMGHCQGGPGPDRFDMLTALEQWVEHGKAPDHVPASHMTEGKVDRTRILCPYPQVAKYDGTGDKNAAASFQCAPSL